MNNYEKSGSNNNTAVHILGHEGKSSIILEKSKIRVKKGQKDRKSVKMHKIIQKVGTFFIIFEKVTLVHATISYIKGLKYALQLIKCSSYT